ncbi:MAG: hypothetical protein JWM20_424 [Patescibacteria group bacterium]|nr:hypothetical protein [Patescibacteria group bacterium]
MDARMNNIVTDEMNKIYVSLTRGGHFLYRKLIKPRSSSEDDRRHEFILNVILSGLLGLLCVYYFLVIDHSLRQGTSYQGVSVFSFTVIIAMTVGLLILSRKGKFGVASYVVVGIFFAGAAYGSYHFGADLQGPLLAYVLVITISSILISIRSGFMMTLLSSATVLAIWHLQLAHIIHPHWFWKYNARQSDATVFVVMFFVIMTLSWLSNREMENSLKRARKSEADLKLERDSLEIKVEERTREIKALQADKLAGLYRSAEIGKLSAGIFHDLMGPLTTVVSSVGELERKPEHLPEVKAYLERAVVASRRLGDFIGTVRKQIRPSAMEELFSLNKELREAVDILKYRSREVGVTLSVVDKKELRVFGNPLRFHQICVNLISNAIDACETAKNSRGDLLGHQSAIHINLSKMDKNAQLKITDRGCGIPESLHAKIFDSFFTTKDYSKGMGLGLSTTKEIVENDFGGTIAVTSMENQGSTFTILIPLSR